MQIRDQAEAIRQYADTARYGLKFQNLAAAFKLKAERRAGELLADLERNPGARTDLTSSHDETRSDYQWAIDDLHIPRPTAHRWELVARVPEGVFNDYIAPADEPSSPLRG